jgi:hypothetical protein
LLLQWDRKKFLFNTIALVSDEDTYEVPSLATFLDEELKFDDQITQLFWTAFKDGKSVKKDYFEGKVECKKDLRWNLMDKLDVCVESFCVSRLDAFSFSTHELEMILSSFSLPKNKGKPKKRKKKKIHLPLVRKWLV